MKILRYRLLLLVLAVGLVPATAQIKFGVKGGVNIANINTSDLGANFTVQNITGFQLGPVMEAILPASKIGGEVGLLYSQRGFKVKSLTDGENANARIGYLDIPLSLKWKPSIGKVNLFVAAGPYIGFKISQNIKLKDINGFNDVVKTNTFSAGLNFGGGVELFKHLQVGFNYALGLTEDYKKDRPGINALLHPKSTVWTVTIAYYF